MEGFNALTDQLFREPDLGTRPLIGQPGPADKAGPQPSEGEVFLVCSRCRAVITCSADGISIDGAHLHTFANPHGLVFEIECFGSAPGCTLEGPPMDDFTWFKGYQWKIAVCRRCIIHLGWLFISSGSCFFGLIADRLSELKSDNPA
jgi:hypothetical protein